ncbi:MAG TPA: glycosyltransferase family 2 protein, partial [Thermoanaerobaculia bacterium]
AGDCVAEAGWIAERVALHAVKRRAVACAITNGGPHTAAGWAAHYLLFASRLAGRAAGPVVPPDPAIHGHSVPRDELLAIGGFRENLRIGEDTDLAARLHARGVEIFFHPAVRTAHFGPTGTIAMLVDQFRRGRRRARTTRRMRSGLALLAALPRDMTFRLAWVVREAWRNAPAERWRVTAIMPWLAAGAAANCTGWVYEQLRIPRATR